MNGWLLVFLIFVATHRLTRLAIKDEVPIVKVPRDKAIRFLDPTPEMLAEEPGLKGHLGGKGEALAYLLECPWCMSVWVGAVVVWATSQFTSVPVPLLVWLGASTFTGLVADFEHRRDQVYALAEIEQRRALAAEQKEVRR